MITGGTPNLNLRIHFEGAIGSIPDKKSVEFAGLPSVNEKWLESDQFIDDFPAIKPPMYGGNPISMIHYRMVEP